MCMKLSYPCVDVEKRLCTITCLQIPDQVMALTNVFVTDGSSGSTNREGRNQKTFVLSFYGHLFLDLFFLGPLVSLKPLLNLFVIFARKVCSWRFSPQHSITELFFSLQGFYYSHFFMQYCRK